MSANKRTSSEKKREKIVALETFYYFINIIAVMSRNCVCDEKLMPLLLRVLFFAAIVVFFASLRSFSALAEIMCAGDTSKKRIRRVCVCVRASLFFLFLFFVSLLFGDSACLSHLLF